MICTRSGNVIIRALPEFTLANRATFFPFTNLDVKLKYRFSRVRAIMPIGKFDIDFVLYLFFKIRPQFVLANN